LSSQGSQQPRLLKGNRFCKLWRKTYIFERWKSIALVQESPISYVLLWWLQVILPGLICWLDLAF